MARKNVRSTTVTMRPPIVTRPRLFRTLDEQKAEQANLNRKLRLKRLKRAGATEADVIAFTASRLRRYPKGSTITKAYG